MRDAPSGDMRRALMTSVTAERRSAGLEPGADFCEHYRYPDDCPDCTDERFDDDGPPDDEYLMAMQEPPS